MDIEICVEKLETVLAAEQLGAKRVELCSALDLGGLTPSLGMVESCIAQSNLDVFVMIRPRGGGFVYAEKEIAIMKRDIQLAANHGANGVVFGCLQKNGLMDVKNNRVLLEEAKSLGLGVTFHRAIDRCRQPEKGIEQLINWGFDRILTSGQKKTAIEGVDKIAYWTGLFGQKIEIMAGSGVNALNAKLLLASGVNALHFTARKKIKQKSSFNMGPMYEVDEDKIKEVIAVLKNKKV